MNCIIIEDQPPAQRILKKYIEDIGSLDLKATFSNAIQALEFLKVESIDLIFLDIHLPKISGIDFLKTINNPPNVILTTAFSDYALESYEFDVVDYLLKPFSFQRFVKAISKIPTKKNQVSDSIESPSAALNHLKTIFIKSGYEHIKVTIDDIIYIKSDADYTEIFTHAKKYISSEPLRFWSDQFDQDQFVRIHKSYIVNTSKIIKVSSNKIYLNDDILLPIGRTYKASFSIKFLKQ